MSRVFPALPPSQFPAKLSPTAVRRYTMRILRRMLILLGIALLTTGAGYYNARAGAWDKMTKVTFSDPVQVPGAVLGAGTYVFKLNESAANRHIVHIFNQDQTKALATILAIPNERMKPA